jgi:hypothetical protein
LRRDQMHFPKRKKDRRRDGGCGSEQEQTRPQIEWFVQKPKFASEKS